MDTIKSAVGLGKKDQEGEEPVSGEQGAGTTAEPLDAGNKQAQAEETPDSATKTSAPEEKAASNADTTEAAQGSPKEDESSKDKKKGGWLKSAIPFGKSKKSDDKAESEQASAGADKPKSDQEEEKKLPPNQLGLNVPSGASTDFAPPGPPGEGASPTETKKAMAQAQEHNESVVNASADKVDEGKFGQAGLLNTDGRSGSQPGRSGSGQPPPHMLRGSRASIAEPSKPRVFNPHGTNPGRIPTAGGVAVGSQQYQRRTSRVSEDLTPPAKKGSMDQEGSPDPATQTNTASNATPQAPSSPPPIMEDEEGGPKDTSAAPVFNEKPFGDSNGAAAPATTSGEEDKSKVEQMKEKAKENLPVGGSSDSKPAESKERRGSTFERFKSKLSGKK